MRGTVEQPKHRPWSTVAVGSAWAVAAAGAVAALWAAGLLIFADRGSDELSTGLAAGLLLGAAAVLGVGGAGWASLLVWGRRRAHAGFPNLLSTLAAVAVAVAIAVAATTATLAAAGVVHTPGVSRFYGLLPAAGPAAALYVYARVAAGTGMLRRRG